MVRDKPKKTRYSSGLLAKPLDMSDRLAKIAIFYHREAQRCADVRCYFTATVIAGAVLEALLLSFCYVEDDRVRLTSVYRHKKFRTRRNRFLEFKLYQLINIATELKWIPSRAFTLGRRKTSHPQLMHRVRQMRNLIHPAAWAQEGGPQRVYKSDYESAYEVLDLTREWLLQRTLHSLRQRMLDEGILPKD
jgi:hypothetical protein